MTFDTWQNARLWLFYRRSNQFLHGSRNRIHECQRILHQERLTIMELYPVIRLSKDVMNEGTSLSREKQRKLYAILAREITKREITKRGIENEALQKFEDSDSIILKKEKLLGCWVDGNLRFQSRDHDAIYEYAGRRMREKRSVWVAPVGSFVTV
jgi:hypothetical protein